MRRSPFAGPVLFAAFAVLVTPVASAGTENGANAATPASPVIGSALPLSGVVRSNGRPIAGATLVVRAFFGEVENVIATIRTEADGTFVLPNARPGLYTLVTVSPGFKPAMARVLHRASQGMVSFVPFELERAGGILPRTALGAADPWVARAVVRGDVLRDEDPVLAGAPPRDTPTATTAEPQVAPGTTAANANTNATVRAALPPVHASLASMAGFASDGPVVSRTRLDVSGAVGEKLHFGVEGQYSRSVSEEGTQLGDSSRFAVDVAPGSEQSFRVSTRRRVLPRDDDPNDPSRYQSHSLDWSGATGATSQASVSARLTSQSNLIASGLAADLFAHATRAFEVQARYRSELLDGGAVGFSVAYRAASAIDFAMNDDRETRVGGTASMHVLPFLVIQGGATGDFSNRARGITPEITVSLESGGWRAFGSAARRYERGDLAAFELGVVSVDPEELTRRARAAIRGGVVYQDADGKSFTVEFSRREMGGTYRFLLEPDFVDRLDSIYFFGGDVSTEFNSSTTFHVGKGVEGRLTARAGRIEGQRDAAIRSDEADYAVADAAIHFTPTDTVVGIGYRSVSQTLSRGNSELKNDLSAIELSLAQTLPLPMLRGSEWRALFSMELGRRREGLEPFRSNRQLAGGLSVAFN